MKGIVDCTVYYNPVVYIIGQLHIGEPRLLTKLSCGNSVKYIPLL